MPAEPGHVPWLPPRWFRRLAWRVHRRIYSASNGSKGLTQPKPGKEGMLCLHTVGRRSGKPHPVILAYIEDGPNLVTMAMNGWMEGEPAWWLNLQANPDTTVDLVEGSRPVRGRMAQGEERERLWSILRDLDSKLDAYATLRPTETAVVVLEPRVQPTPG
jgi:deazaflavin-dependent oxidoreductase (nitroreductase family)